MALMLLQVLVLGVIAAAADDVPLTWYWSTRALLPCALPDAARVLPRRPAPPLNDTPRAKPYAWKKDGVQYFPNRVFSNGTLEVRRREGGDGVFQCAARTQPGVVLGYPVRLRTAHMEKFSTHPENTTAHDGQSVLLSCIISSVPPASVSWLRDGGNLPSDDRYFLLNNQLLITDVRPSDQGLYRCITSNSYLNKTRVSHGGRLQVQGSQPLPPSFLPTNEERELMVAQGESIQLPCAVRGWPRPEVTWTLETSDGSTTELDDTEEVLIRTDMDVAREGIYTCRVRGRNNLVKSFKVLVTQPVRVVLPPVSKDALRASTVRLNCSAEGRPAPNITWYKNGEPLPLTGRVGQRKSYSDEDRIELVISSVTSDDAGIYQCFASNNISVASAWATLTVSGMGLAPPDQVACEPVDARHVAVRWTAPWSEPVVAYTVHTTPQGTQGSTQPGQPLMNTQEVVQLSEALTPFRFQVRAYIRLAKSTATDFSEAVVCQGQGVPVKLMKLDAESVLVSWRQFAEETPGVVQWIFQSKTKGDTVEHNVTLDAAVTEYTVRLRPESPLLVRVLGTRSLPWLAMNLTRVPWLPADHGNVDAMPRELKVTQIGPHSITVQWEVDELPGKHDFLLCVTKRGDNGQCQPSDKKMATIDDLQPNTKYEVRVQTRLPDRESVEAVLPYQVTTQPEGPKRFKEMTYKFINATTLRVSWSGALARYSVRYSPIYDLPKEAWKEVKTTGNTVLLTDIQPGAQTYVKVRGYDPLEDSTVLTIPPETNSLGTKDLSYVYTSSGITVSWAVPGPRTVRFSQELTAPMESWHKVNVTETHVQLTGLDASLPTFVTVTAADEDYSAQVLNIPPRPADYSALSIGVGVACLVCVLILLGVAAFCIWRRRKMAQSPVRSRRRNLSPTEAHEGESSEMKSVGGRLANGGAGEPLLNGRAHITENPTVRTLHDIRSKTPNGKMRKARYEAFDVSRHDADTTAETVVDDSSVGYSLLDTSRRPDLDTSRSLSTNNSFNKLPDDNMNSEIPRSAAFVLDNSKIQPTLQPNG